MQSILMAEDQSLSPDWFQRFSTRLGPTGKSNKTGSARSSPSKTQQAKVDYQRISIEAKRIQQQFEKKDKQRAVQINRREEFLSRSTELWTEEILPYWQKHGDLLLTRNSEIYKLWWYGLPPSIRGQVWKTAIGNELGITDALFREFEFIAREKLHGFKQVEKRRIEDLSLSSDSNETSQAYYEFIQLDVSRTFPQLGLFQNHGPYHDQLQLLLCMYVYFSPDIGYVQGQAFLAAMLLLNLDLFDSFLCFVNLLHRPYFQSFYRFKYMEKYLQLFTDLLRVHLPKLSAHFSAMSIEANYFALDWFFTIYSKSLPLDIVARVWDLFFRDGESLIFRTALAILSVYEEHLCQLDTFHCLQFLTRLPDTLDGKVLFDAIDRIQLQPSDSALFHLIA